MADLFQQTGVRHAPSPTSKPTLSQLQRVQDLLVSANKDLLPEAVKYLKWVPENLHPLVSKVSVQIFEDEFKRIALGALESKQAACASKTPLMMAHSAKLSVFSSIQFLALLPWQLANKSNFGTIEQAIESTDSFDTVREILLANGAVSLFIGATRDDDLDSYVKSVKSIIASRKVAYLVLDPEVVEPAPSAVFPELRDKLGFTSACVELCERSKIADHPWLKETGHFGLPVILVNSNGRPLSRIGDIDVGDDVDPELSASERTRAARSGPADALKLKLQGLRDKQSKALARKP